MALKKYNIKVNGKSYEVEVEEIETRSAVAAERIATPSGNTGNIMVKKEPVYPVTPTKNQVNVPGAGQKEVITAPLPGKVMSLKVEVGQVVQAGDLICVLEAMKMENELYASVNGTIQEVLVAEGATVADGEILVIIA